LPTFLPILHFNFIHFNKIEIMESLLDYNQNKYQVSTKIMMCFNQLCNGACLLGETCAAIHDPALKARTLKTFPAVDSPMAAGIAKLAARIHNGTLSFKQYESRIHSRPSWNDAVLRCLRFVQEYTSWHSFMLSHNLAQRDIADPLYSFERLYLMHNYFKYVKIVHSSRKRAIQPISDQYRRQEGDDIAEHHMWQQFIKHMQMMQGNDWPAQSLCDSRLAKWCTPPSSPYSRAPCLF
jgi:hypothetical protein